MNENVNVQRYCLKLILSKTDNQFDKIDSFLFLERYLIRFYITYMIE